MKLAGIPESKNYTDETNVYNQFSRHPSGSMDPRTKYHTPPIIPYHELTNGEKYLVHRHGFSPEDIVLMRSFHSTPEQVMQGWKLLKPELQ